MKPSALATIDKSDLDRFRQIDAQFKSIEKQRLQLQDLEAGLFIIQKNFWLEIIKKYSLPTIEDLENDNFDLKIKPETGEIFTCSQL